MAAGGPPRILRRDSSKLRAPQAQFSGRPLRLQNSDVPELFWKREELRLVSKEYLCLCHAEPPAPEFEVSTPLRVVTVPLI